MKYIIPGIIMLVVLLTVAYVGVRLDWAGVRSAQATNCSKEVRDAIEFGLNYCEVPPFYKPVFRGLLAKASEHEWAASEALKRKYFDEFYSENAIAREYIMQAREFCPVMRVPAGEPLWEKPF